MDRSNTEGENFTASIAYRWALEKMGDLEVDAKKQMEGLEWESGEQKKSYESYLHWCHQKNIAPDMSHFDLWLLQRLHEMDRFYVELIGTRVAALEDEIARLRLHVEHS